MCDEQIDITAEYGRNGLLLSTIYRDQYYKRLFILFDDDTEEEARAEFVEYVKEEDRKITTYRGRTMSGSIADCLRSINWTRGRGEIVSIGSNYFERWVPITHHTGFKERRAYTVRDGKVRALGTSRKVG